MGEIGRDRREYLYEMSYCEILLIIRGYRHRNILQYQLQRLQAYGAFFCMGGAEKTPNEWIPMYFDKYIQNRGPELTVDEKDELLADMAALNGKRQES